MAFEFKGICHFLADFKGLRHEAKIRNPLEGFEARLVIDELPNVGLHQPPRFGVGFEFCRTRGIHCSLAEMLERRHNQNTECFFILTDHHALIDKRGLDESGLDGHRLDVFAIQQNNRILRTAENFQAIIGRHHPDVSGIHPSIAQYQRRRLGVFVVTAHDLRALHMNFPAKPATSQWTSGIRVKNRACAKIDDPNFRVWKKWPNRSDHEVAPSPHGQHGRCFRHAVAFENRDANEVEKSSDDDLQKQLPVGPKNTLSAEQMLFEPMHMVDYFASQGIKLSQEALQTDKLGKQLKSFTEWLKTMKKVHPEKVVTIAEKTELLVQNLAEKSNIEDDVLTEAMAEVFAMQGKNNKAIEVYEKLSLLNPLKSAYFAAKILPLKG